MILRQFDVDAYMTVNIGNDLDIQRLVSLQLADLLSYRELQLNIKCMVKDQDSGIYRRLFTCRSEVRERRREGGWVGGCV